ncbi:MAG TPA: T9SS type A sorting domain-containing protein [Ferruginibacter sp.]|nr:T9SS type A sorting domain-containing protein [Ferruginibacter sp.]HPH92635.1 T9SS type A sorting domain-containing protein [Ferruginibacter sp.]
MRKTLIFTAISILIIVSCCKAQYVTIPDTALRNFFISQYPGCFNGAGQMDTTCSAIVNETHLTCASPGIVRLYENLDGVQYFKNLTFFDCHNQYADLSGIRLANTIDTLLCSYNAVGPAAFPSALKILDCTNCNYTALPPLPAGLKVLQCIDNTMLSTLPSLPQGLKVLNCWNTSYPSGSLVYLTSLPPLPDSLEFLNCSSNSLTSLPPLPPALKYLNFSYNSITTVSFFPTGLTEIQAYANQLVSLPTLPASLEKLYVYANRLTALPALPASLSEFECSSNEITSMPALPATLFYFGCGGNELTSLPDLPASLGQLKCSGNLLTSLPALPSTLFILECFSNRLTSLPELAHTSLWNIYCCYNDIYCLPWLPPNCSIVLDTAKIKCLPNINNNAFYTPFWSITDIYPVQLPLCTPVNNTNQCRSFPVMQGLAFYDNNNNGIRDIDEPVKQHCRIDLSNDTYTFTNKEGFFEIAADSTEAYTLSAATPEYFDTNPPVYNYHFSRYDTIVSGNFAFHANTTIDLPSIKLIPLNWAARPGFPLSFFVGYSNDGTTVLSSPSIDFNYDSSKLFFDSSSYPLVANGNNLYLNTSDLVPGAQGSLMAYFRVKPNVVLDDSILTKIIFSTNAITAMDSSKMYVRGAFDPNDKQATPQLSPSQVANGDYIDYTIRFQNTGTDTAFTVVISDTLSDDLQANTLQVTASSHNCKTTVKNNVVFFEFLNILLPDSNINEPNSHGFVSFRIKPQTTVAPNTTIPNKAAIYFDYNAPVITNTAGTLIKDFIVLPLKLISFNAVLQNDNTTSLYWTTANEINTRHFIIERSHDGLRFSSITNIFAKGQANNNYNAVVTDAFTGIAFYRLKIMDNDGSFVYSPLVKIDRRKNTTGFTVLSNPVKEVVIINTTDRSLHNTQASIINMQGRLVKVFALKEGNQRIDIRELPAGIYNLRTTNGTVRILIQ